MLGFDIYSANSISTRHFYRHCKELIFQFSKKKLSFARLVIEGTPVEVVDSIKILGLAIQNDMKWHKYIYSILTTTRGKRL